MLLCAQLADIKS